MRDLTRFRRSESVFVCSCPAQHQRFAVAMDVANIADDLAAELTCSICNEIVTDPKTLPCLHSFCLRCISNWFETCNREGSPRTCPLCNAEVQESDCLKLPSAFYLNALLPLLEALRATSQETPLPVCTSCEKPAALVAFCPQCSGMICDVCIKAHETFVIFREHHITFLNEFTKDNINSYVRTQMLCEDVSVHEKREPYKYYCQEENCRKCICQVCATLAHRDHDVTEIEKAATEVKKALKHDLDRVKQLAGNYQQEVEDSNDNMMQIEGEFKRAKQKVRETTETAVKLLRDNEESTLRALDETLVELRQENQDEQTDIKAAIERVRQFLLHEERLLDRNIAPEVLKSDEVIRQRCQTVLAKLSIMATKPVHRNVTVHYVTNTQVMQSLHEIGMVVKSATDPSRSCIESLKQGRCGFISEFDVITRNSKEDVCYTEEDVVDITITYANIKPVPIKIRDKLNGRYRVTYKPDKSGEYTIFVKVGGMQIKNSPQTVQVLNVNENFKPDRTFCVQSSNRGELEQLYSLVFDDNDHIAIVDRGNHRIQIFTNKGKYLQVFGVKGKNDGELTNPYCVVIIGDAFIVSDNPDGKGRLQEFDMDGKHVTTLYRHKEKLRGICVADDENIAVCCIGSEQAGIKVFSRQGDLIREFDENQQPWNIDYSNGQYFASYFDENCIRVFDVEGHSLFKFGQKGHGDGQFNNAAGLAVYGPELILVCDLSNHRIQLFTQEGRFIRSFGSHGSSVGRMIAPTDVVVTSDGHCVLVLESTGGRVHVWR